MEKVTPFLMFQDGKAEEAMNYYTALIEALMPLGDYGFSKKFGWLNDRFGVSWQLDLPK